MESGQERYFKKLVRDIHADLGGKRELTRIELEMVDVFAGSAVIAKYLIDQVLLGEIAEIDLQSFDTNSSTMLRIGKALGFGPRTFDEPETMQEFLARRAKERAAEQPTDNDEEAPCDDAKPE